MLRKQLCAVIVRVVTLLYPPFIRPESSDLYIYILQYESGIDVVQKKKKNGKNKKYTIDRITSM